MHLEPLERAELHAVQSGKERAHHMAQSDEHRDRISGQTGEGNAVDHPHGHRAPRLVSMRSCPHAAAARRLASSVRSSLKTPRSETSAPKRWSKPESNKRFE